MTLQRKVKRQKEQVKSQKSKESFLNKASFNFLLLAFSISLLTFCKASAHATIQTASFGGHVTGETVGVTTTTISYTIADAISNIQIDIYHLRDVSDVPSQSNQVASLPQTGVAIGPHTVVWDALWPVGGVVGRQDGLFKIILTDLTTSLTYSIATFLNITSVDIHNVTITPSFDANSNPALPYLVSYALAKDSLVTVRVLNSSGTIVRTIGDVDKPQFGELVKPLNTVGWNGLDDTGRPVALGIYTVTIDAKDPGSSDHAIQRTGPATIASLANLDTDIKKTFENNNFVFPNPARDGNVSTTCGYPACFQLYPVRNHATIKLKIYTIAGDLVREETFSNQVTGNVGSFSWDLTNQAGKKIGRGLYYVVFREEDEEGTIQVVKKLAVIR
jgi:flagellar hook assembly protein FlgD